MANNPFEHHHGHDHDHDHGPLEVDAALDPAQQSLADALRVSFLVLKGVMVVLVVVYFCSGIFKVEEQQVAVKLRFGKIVGDSPETQVLRPGRLYWAWPYPIEQVVRVPTTDRLVEINQAFWWERPPGQADAGKTEDEQTGKTGPLNPEKDGSLLTADANIVHGRFALSYKIASPVDYLKHVGDPSEKVSDPIVLAAAEQGVVHAAAGTTADEMLTVGFDRSATIARIQSALDAMQSGITVTQLSVTKTAMPMSVREAYQEVINAASQRAGDIERAEQKRTEILVQAAGEGWAPLWDLVRQYEEATDLKDSAKLAELDNQLDTALEALSVPGPEGTVHVGGEVAQVINAAKSYRSQLVEGVKAEADAFERQLPQYRLTPRIVLSRIWQETKREILTGDVETFYLPAGQPYLEINRDPQVSKNRQVEHLKAQDAARRSGAGN